MDLVDLGILGVTTEERLSPLGGEVVTLGVTTEERLSPLGGEVTFIEVRF